MVRGIDPDTFENPRARGRRDPDALPPRNVLEWAMNRGYEGVRGLAHGNALFAIKAAVLTRELKCFNLTVLY